MSFWDIVWFIIISFAFIAYLMVMLNIITDLFRDHGLSGWLKAVWIFCLIFFPFLTAIVYLIARGGGMAQRQVETMQRMQKSQEQYIQSVATGASPASQISEAQALFAAGTINQAEFDALKAKALA